MPFNCQQINIAINDIRKLKADFDAALETGKLDRSKAIQAELENKISILQEQLVSEPIRRRESEKLSVFFGKDVDVPPIPKPITYEQFKYWEQMGFELHYLPAEEMTQDKNFPGWIKKPDQWFYDEIKEGNIVADATTLKGEWVLIDGRPKPDYRNGDGMYANDPLKSTLVNLRRVGAISGYKHPSSRLNVTHNELQSESLKIAFARVLHTLPEKLSLLRFIEWNFIGNVHHPEWGNNDLGEWFQDNYASIHFRLGGGGSAGGGLSYARHSSPDLPIDELGFRLLIRFSN
ncbi:hypothetical protein EPO05_05765 [Patescibacteria group bacterium]|nr:MAG: hypothetical protein EPO05_05765 [Patescibacteria group bacterium]